MDRMKFGDGKEKLARLMKQLDQLPERMKKEHGLTDAQAEATKQMLQKMYKESVAEALGDKPGGEKN